MIDTYESLNERVATLLQDALHGRTVDMMQSVEPRLPHMLGYTPLGEPVHESDTSGTLLDPTHEFWDEYAEAVTTDADARGAVITAINILDKKGLLQINYPYGEEAGVAYIEVETPTNGSQSRHTATEPLATTCVKCGAAIDTAPSLTTVGEEYIFVVPIDCPECSFERRLRV